MELSAAASHHIVMKKGGFGRFTTDDVRSFVTIFLGRSGSTYLMEALNDHSLIRADLEEMAMHIADGPEHQLEHARRLLTPEKHGAHAAIGFKTKLKDVLDAEGFARLIRELGTRIIVLQRRNVVKWLVSWHRSEELSKRTGDWNLYSEKDRPAPITIDIDIFASRLEQIELSRNRTREFVYHLERPTLLIYYEDLLTDERAMLEMICAFLGVPFEPIRGRSIKNTSDDLSQAIANFNQLKARYAGTHYEPMFDEVLVRPSGS